LIIAPVEGRNVRKNAIFSTVLAAVHFASLKTNWWNDIFI